METGVIELGSDGEPLPAGTFVQPDQIPAPVRYLRRRRRELDGKVKTRKLPPTEEVIPLPGVQSPTETDHQGSAPSP